MQNCIELLRVDRDMVRAWENTKSWQFRDKNNLSSLCYDVDNITNIQLKIVKCWHLNFLDCLRRLPYHYVCLLCTRYYIAVIPIKNLPIMKAFRTHFLMVVAYLKPLREILETHAKNIVLMDFPSLNLYLEKTFIRNFLCNSYHWFFAWIEISLCTYRQYKLCR